MIVDTLNGYTLDKLPDDNVIINSDKGIPEIIGYIALADLLAGADPKIKNVNYLFRYGLRKELLTDGIYIPLPYGTRDSGQAVLVHCGYELVLEHFYATFASPLGLTPESVKLFTEKYLQYVGDRTQREQEQKLNQKLHELSVLQGISVADLRKKLGIK